MASAKAAPSPAHLVFDERDEGTAPAADEATNERLACSYAMVPTTVTDRRKLHIV